MYNYSIRRTTFETDVVGSICPNNNASIIKTGIPSLNHILSQWSTYSKLCLKLHCVGDIIVDYHHSFEDIGIVLGMLLNNLIRKNNLFRYSHAIIPMDETLVRCCIALSGQPGLYWTNKTKHNLFNPTLELIYTLLNSLVWNSNINIHIDLIKLDSVHHVSEAIFKSFGVCLFQSMNSIQNIRSTKNCPIINWN
ncbi:Imidazoleglycerol-phosphate dehydratase [Candidatus Hodgkinia cicadicola]|uniref:Imidazoleglycerol-phosphate dehydratase n=1 Tax=Candidatus Hodgkinia cicadicola TaxID=573658 RepID=A0ABX4MI07_9HYPH|nr:Imidazoleglycerol-phosphate dehydratase [Candidatus Hodgkinia cicadicola]